VSKNTLILYIIFTWRSYFERSLVEARQIRAV